MTLAVDSGSPLISICLGTGSQVLATDAFAGGPSSPSLLGRIDSLLQSIDRRPHEIERVIGARGPGSFTGLRSGLATLVGLSEALDVRATAVSTFQALASQSESRGRVLAAIDALRGEWYVQAFDSSAGRSSAKGRILPVNQLLDTKPASIVAFDSERLARLLPATSEVVVQEAGPLAPNLLEIADRSDTVWDARLLTSPLYLRPPAVSPPASRGALVGPASDGHEAR